MLRYRGYQVAGSRGSRGSWESRGSRGSRESGASRWSDGEWGGLGDGGGGDYPMSYPRVSTEVCGGGQAQGEGDGQGKRYG